LIFIKFSSVCLKKILSSSHDPKSFREHLTIDDLVLAAQLPLGDTQLLSPLDQLTTSHDGKRLYGLNGSSGQLYEIDSEKGSILHLETIKEARTHKLLGVSKDGKPFIQGISY